MENEDGDCHIDDDDEGGEPGDESEREEQCADKLGKDTEPRHKRGEGETGIGKPVDEAVRGRNLGEAMTECKGEAKDDAPRGPAEIGPEFRDGGAAEEVVEYGVHAIGR